MKTGYIYRYLYNGEVVYIGQTKNELRLRVKQHCKEIAFFGLTEIQYIEIPNATAKILNSTEEFYIDYYNPVLNQRYRPELIEEDSLVRVKEKDWKDFVGVFEIVNTPMPIFCKVYDWEKYRSDLIEKVFEQIWKNTWQITPNVL